MTRRSAALPLAVILAVSLLEGCRKKPAPTTAPSTVSPVDATAEQRRADSVNAAAAAQRRADSIAAVGVSPGSSTSSAASVAQMRTVLSQVIYFDYDKDELREDARAALDAKAPVLIANSAVTVVITGHTDERGTSEYNFALGQRRAAQVKRYLESRGVPGGQMTTQSAGDARPASDGTAESDYQRNRRAEFEAQNTGTLMRPRS